jgi:ABC-2 type transport system permease protein
MTTTTDASRPTPRVPDPTISGVPFSRLTRVELRKMVDTRAGMWLLAAIGAVTLAVVIIFLFAAHRPELTYTNFVSATGTPQGLLLPVLGILTITSEWSQRTGLITFTLEPHRQRVVWAKFTALMILGIAAVALALLLAVPGNALGDSLRDGNGSWSFGAGGVRDVLILQLLGLIQGFAFGMLFMNSAAAIVMYYVLPIASSIIFGLVSWLNEHVASWLDQGTAQGHLQEHDMHGHYWSYLAVNTAIWVVLPLVLGLVRLLRSELKSY